MRVRGASTRSYDTTLWAGDLQNSYAGTALSWIPCSDSLGNGTDKFGLYHGGNVSSLKKHLYNVIHQNSATGTALSNYILI